MATKTLVTATENFDTILDPTIKLKISRKQVKSIVMQTTIFNFSNNSIRKRFSKDKEAILRNLSNI